MAITIKNQKPKIKNTPWLAAIIAAALAVRVGVVVVFHLLPAVPLAGRSVGSPAEQPLFPDADEYRRMARHVRAGRGPILAHGCAVPRMPGYPVFLAGLWAVTGESLLAVRLVQAAFGAATVWLVALLARELFGEPEALAAAAVAAAYPFFIFYTVLVLSETVFMALLVAGALCLAAAVRRGRGGLALLAGALLGLATLVRASLLPCVPLLAVGWVLVRRVDRTALRHAGLMVAAFAAMMAPWVVRNWVATDGHVVVTTLRAGASLYESLNPQADGGPMLEVVNSVPRPAGMSEAERDRQLGRLAVAYAIGHPRRFAELAVVKLGRFWNPVPNAREFRTPLFAVALGVPYVAAMLLAAAGLARSWRHGRVALILLLPVVYHSVVHMVYVGSIRYRVVVMPLVVVLGAHGLVGLRHMAASRNGNSKCQIPNSK